MVTKTKETKPAPKSASTKTPTKRSSHSLSHDEIARQAYMLWLERGGSAMDNWLDAERRLH